MSDNTTVELTVKEQMAKLQELIAWFESDDFSLEQAQEKFKEAEVLADEIRGRLTQLKSDITVLAQKFDDDAA